MGNYWQRVWVKFRSRRLGMAALFVVLIFCFVGIYAPFFASSKAIVAVYHGKVYFPLFDHLFYQGFFTKSIDLFFNLLMFTLPLFFIFRTKKGFSVVLALQLILFTYLMVFPIKNPLVDPVLAKKRQEAAANLPSWQEDLSWMTKKAKLDLVLSHKLKLLQHQKLKKLTSSPVSTLWQIEQDQQQNQVQRYKEDASSYAKAKLKMIKEKNAFLEEEQKALGVVLMPLISHFHWEDDAGGDQSMNAQVPFLELTRTNRKSLVAALIFGIRVSLVVGVLAISLAALIGIPIGSLAGFFRGKVDIVVSRILEIWESMPVFFMLLLVVAMTESKSIFLVIAIVGLFGWTGIARTIRSEFFKQATLPYVEALHALGFPLRKIIFSEILPNALPPVLTLLPFAIMGAMTTEAGLSFLGLGEEGTSSWGVLMDEGRQAFPAESYLLWPPAILLTTLLVAIALAGDAFRDALDPRVKVKSVKSL